jgi:hypothetical protein
LDTTTATNPLVQLLDQLCKQSDAVHAILLKEIAAISPSDPDDQPEFDILRKFFAENQEKIESQLEEQLTIVEELFELSGRQAEPSLFQR